MGEGSTESPTGKKKGIDRRVSGGLLVGVSIAILMIPTAVFAAYPAVGAVETVRAVDWGQASFLLSGITARVVTLTLEEGDLFHLSVVVLLIGGGAEGIRFSGVFPGGSGGIPEQPIRDSEEFPQTTAGQTGTYSFFVASDAGDLAVSLSWRIESSYLGPGSAILVMSQILSLLAGVALGSGLALIAGTMGSPVAIPGPKKVDLPKPGK